MKNKTENGELKFPKFNKETIYFMMCALLFGILIGRVTVHKTNSSDAADKIEYLLKNIEKSTYNMYSNYSKIEDVNKMYFNFGTVSRSMLEYKMEEICGTNYQSDYDNVTKRMFEAFEKCGCNT